MALTDYHASFFAHELARRCSADSVEKFVAVLADAQVDLNPHQVEAALFAFRSPFSKGAILADEVGLGKTIEAGLLIAQRWAERKRKLLVIAPANLRKQWAQELADKFFLPSVILDSKSFNEIVKKGNLNPFAQQAVVLCSYQFARTKEPYIKQTMWDLVVIDEAHRLRNVYKGTSKIAKSIKEAVEPFHKVLLTATPLQNSLLELYGLTSIIDEHAFGDFESYKSKFTRLDEEPNFFELKERLKPLCKRTLRKQVLSYIKFTARHALVHEFVPSDDEQRLYESVSAYLLREKLYALPASQRNLITLVLRKLLASSSFAITGTLEKMVARLEKADKACEEVTEPPEEMQSEFETFDELEDEWEGDKEGTDAWKPGKHLSPEEREEMRAELAELRGYLELAKSIQQNHKGNQLLVALGEGFAEAKRKRQEAESPVLVDKAVIFTESRRTQLYLLGVLEANGYAGKVMLFNGTNTDAASKAIYAAWALKHAGTDRVSRSPSADMRAALVDHFRDSASILIATEAAAEGINLQFCNLVINYDLPWNPQRIEQRIGRCHRYGQKCDVVVVNFINLKNAADKRVYDLLAQKFKLFDGVFGASDEVLGALESGLDFEQRIAAIMQKCRTPEQIEFEFDRLQEELEEEIQAGHRDAREKLLDNFEQEVIEKVRMRADMALDKFSGQLWGLTKHMLAGAARFDDAALTFTLTAPPALASGETVHAGPYVMGRGGMTEVAPGFNLYRSGHPLALWVVAQGRSLRPTTAGVMFDLSGSGKRIAILEGLKGQSGWMTCVQTTLIGAETEDVVVVVGTVDGARGGMDGEQCQRLFDLPGSVGEAVAAPDDAQRELRAQVAARLTALQEAASARQGKWFDEEIAKLDRWAEDRRAGLKAALTALDEDIREARQAARTAGSLPEKLEKQRAIRPLEQQREAAFRSFDVASRNIDQQKEVLLDSLENRLKQGNEQREFFVLRWSVR